MKGRKLGFNKGVLVWDKGFGIFNSFMLVFDIFYVGYFIELDIRSGGFSVMSGIENCCCCCSCMLCCIFVISFCVVVVVLLKSFCLNVFVLMLLVYRFDVMLMLIVSNKLNLVVIIFR